MSLIIRYRVLLLGMMLSGLLKAQQIPYLEKPVTIRAVNQTLADLFKSISTQTEVIFSYAQSFDDKQRFSLNCTRKPLRLVLNDLLKNGGCSYKCRDKFIILKCDNKPVVLPSIVTGYVYNAADSSIVAEASIYIKQTKHSAVSNAYGFFSVSFSNKLPDISLSFAKENFKDTTLVVYNRNKQEVLIYLYPKSIPQKIETLQEESLVVWQDSLPAINVDSSTSKKSPLENFWKTFNMANANLRNISDTLFSNVSLSFIPYVSTNRLLSINTINKVSFNILAGYSKGISILEIGGLFNIDHGSVKYIQVAGLGNMVSGDVTGMQVGGLYNVNGGVTKGVQVSGLLNINKSHVEGIQVSGLWNRVAGHVKGIQVAGLVNDDQGTQQGFQMAGIYNRNKGHVSGFQLAGLVNEARNMEGVQMSGIYNKADTVKGFQFSGLINQNHYHQGTQLSALVNITKVSTGNQISFLNIADSSSGIAIGFLSVVKKGYHKLEIGSDELLFGTISFGTGVEKFHTIFIAGINYSKPEIWTYGYGIGTGVSLKGKWIASFNLTAQQLQSSADVKLRLLSKLTASLEYQVKPKIRVGFGPTFNLLATDIVDRDYTSTFSTLPPYHFYESTEENTNLKMWVGGRVYLKLF